MRRVLLIPLVLMATSCRDVPALFTPAATADTARITFSTLDDRAPAWSSGSDSLFYTAQSYPPFVATNGVLLAAPRTGGTVRAILPAVQVGSATLPWLTAPAFSADGESIAFVEVSKTMSEACDSISAIGGAVPADTVASASTLQQAVLRVRRRANATAVDDARLVIDFDGRSIDFTQHPLGLDYVIVNVAHPFQRHFDRYGVPVFRPSWSPDGSKLVYSDGLRLRIWTIGQAASVPIANTDDGVLPAWSADGEWIAFTRLERGAVAHAQLVCWRFGARGPVPFVAYDRTIYDAGNREAGTLMLIRPDGSGAQSLGKGEAPAWLPDSKAVVVHRDGQLYRVGIDGSATAVSETDQAYEPAVSRDGEWIAFAKLMSRGDFDIWRAHF